MGYGTVRYGTVRYGVIWYGTVRYGTVRCGTVRYGTVRYGTVRYGTVHHHPNAWLNESDPRSKNTSTRLANGVLKPRGNWQNESNEIEVKPIDSFSELAMENWLNESMD